MRRIYIYIHVYHVYMMYIISWHIICTSTHTYIHIHLYVYIYVYIYIHKKSMYVDNWHVPHAFIINVCLHPPKFIPVVCHPPQRSNSRPAIGSTSSTESARATKTGKVLKRWLWKMIECSSVHFGFILHTYIYINHNVMLNSRYYWFWIPCMDLPRFNWPYLVFPHCG